MKRNCLRMALLAWLLWVKQSPIGTGGDNLFSQMTFTSQPAGAYETQAECESGIDFRLHNWAEQHRASEAGIGVSYPSVIVWQKRKKDSDPLSFYIINFYCYPAEFDPRPPASKK